MPYVATCTFREPAKSYYLEPGDLDVHVDTPIIAETGRGMELGRIKFLPREMSDDKIVPPLRSIVRIATAEDIAQDAENRQREEEILQVVRDRIAYHNLPMKPIKVELMHDRSKLFFFYEAEERVDFRDLLRDLSGLLEMRLQFHQVTAREAAKVLGGCGPCGKPLCCSTFLTSMPPVTLKMAKEQGMALTPSKISGACGRLMCCLRYEIDFYRDQNQRMPRPGSPVDTPQGPGHIIDVNLLTEVCIVELGDGRRVPIEGDALRAIREERGPVRACSNHISQGGSCGGAEAGGCSSSGGCGSKGGGCGSKKGGCGSCGKSGGCGSRKKQTVAV